MSAAKLQQRARVVATILAQQHSHHPDYMAGLQQQLVDEELAELAKEQSARERQQQEERER